MKRSYVCVALVYWIYLLVPAALAQTQVFATSADYIASLNKSSTDKARDFHEWNSERGDLNGDGMADLAMIVSYSDDSGGGVRTRLVVLAGIAGGGYRVLSQSNQYCNAQKFYNLTITAMSLYVQAVHKADSDELASETLQFRFNKKLGDLEAIGQENVWESYSRHSWGRLSKNYLTGAGIESEKVAGRVVQNKKTTSQPKPLIRLNGFSC